MASHRTRVALAGFGAGAILIGGLAVVAADDEAPARVAAPSQTAPNATAPNETAPNATAPNENAPQDVQTCGVPTREAILTVVAGQLAAFAADDWEAARGFATSTFQQGVDAQMLEEIILEGYPIVAEALDARIGACVTSGVFAQAEIEVLGDGGRTQRLAYVLTFEDGAWRIAGAGEPGGGAPGSSPGEATTAI